MVLIMKIKSSDGKSEQETYQTCFVEEAVVIDYVKF